MVCFQTGESKRTCITVQDLLEYKSDSKLKISSIQLFKNSCKSFEPFIYSISINRTLLTEEYWKFRIEKNANLKIEEQVFNAQDNTYKKCIKQAIESIITIIEHNTSNKLNYIQADFVLCKNIEPEIWLVGCNNLTFESHKIVNKSATKYRLLRNNQLWYVNGYEKSHGASIMNHRPSSSYQIENMQIVGKKPEGWRYLKSSFMKYEPVNSHKRRPQSFQSTEHEGQRGISIFCYGSSLKRKASFEVLKRNRSSHSRQVSQDTKALKVGEIKRPRASKFHRMKSIMKPKKDKEDLLKPRFHIFVKYIKKLNKTSRPITSQLIKF